MFFLKDPHMEYSRFRKRLARILQSIDWLKEAPRVFSWVNVLVS